jgi:hypothetical protein
MPIERWKDIHASASLDTMLDLTGQNTKLGTKSSLRRARF